MRHLLISFVLLSLSFSLGCGDNNLPKYSALGGLRILGLVVDTPEIQNPSAGTVNVNLTPYISDISGTGNVSLEVQSCLDPGVALGASADCSSAQYASTLQTISMTAPTGQTAGVFGSPERTGAPSTGAISVGLQIPANFLAGYSAALQLNGVAYLITLKVTSGASVVKSFRRVLISSQTPNTNPTITDLLSNSTSLTALPTGSVELSFTTSTAPGSYQLMTSNGGVQNVAKVYQVTWFVSDGEVANPRTLATETTTWVTGAAPSGRKTVVVGVMHDGRGGTSVLVKTF